MAEVLAWCFRSPARLVTVAVAALAVLLGVGALLFNGPESEGAGSRSGSAALTLDEAESSPTVSAVQPDIDPFVSTAVDFVAAWAAPAKGVTAEDWHAGVRALATPELAAGLRHTELAALPAAGPAGEPAVRFVSERSALVAVPLADGEVVLVTVVSVGEQWRVSDIQPDAGD